MQISLYFCLINFICFYFFLLKLCKGKLITVFGCGGDRDRSKRPLMGSIAEEFSDHLFITSDNPRSEEPQQIVNDILMV